MFFFNFFSLFTLHYYLNGIPPPQAVRPPFRARGAYLFGVCDIVFGGASMRIKIRIGVAPYNNDVCDVVIGDGLYIWYSLVML